MTDEQHTVIIEDILANFYATFYYKKFFIFNSGRIYKLEAFREAKDFVDEWKTATETSQKFDEFLIDLRKYGFTLLTGLITAGSFLGFSFADKSPAESLNSNILHLGVIYVTMFLVVILFWLDVYYQNLLYGSVLRTRFLEFFRLNYRLSVYISGVYTGSHMANVLYLIYFGFLSGIIVLGFLVYKIAGRPTQGLIILLASSILSGAGMVSIIYKGIGTRGKKLRCIMKLFEEYQHLPKEELTNERIMKLEDKVVELFRFEV